MFPRNYQEMTENLEYLELDKTWGLSCIYKIPSVYRLSSFSVAFGCFLNVVFLAKKKIRNAGMAVDFYPNSSLV